MLVEGVQRGRDARAARPVEHAAPSTRPAPRPGSFSLSARVTLVSRVPNRKVCTRLRASVTAWRKCRNSRVYWLIEPEISSSATIGGILVLRPEIFQVDHRAAGLHAGAQGAAHVDDVAVRMRRQPPRLHLVERQHQPLDRVLGGGDLGRRHLREILLLQHLAVGHREPRVDLDLRLLALALRRRRRTAPPACAARPAAASASRAPAPAAASPPSACSR